jgi:KDO2-lipid IV(A) lauroyltransferase
MISIIKYFFQALIIYSFFLIIKILGLVKSRRLFSYIFKKIGPLIKSNDIIKKNLDIFSDKLSEKEKKSIQLNMWSNYGKTFVEYIFLKKFKKENSHIEIQGKQILDKIRKNNKPVIFISGHFANFEFMSMEITKNKIDLATIYRPLNNFFLNPFMEYVRKKYICNNQIKKGRLGVKECINYLNNNYSIALMIDQRVSEGDRIDFFKKKAHTTSLPAQLSIKFNLDVVPIFIVRKQNDSFKMKVYEPINTSNFKNKSELTKKLNQILENMISKNPNQWIWTHNRWK